MNFLLLKKTNKLFIVIFFLIIFIYFVIYPDQSTKDMMMDKGSIPELGKYYGLWGYINDSIYRFFSYILGPDFLNVYLISELIL